jgi:tRNA(Ile)-lysidine synthase
MRPDSGIEDPDATGSDVGLAADFAAAMRELGPFEPNPALAVAVSGGADSMALAMLARDWASGCGGSVFALVVDHGLRPASGAEARTTVERLGWLGIPSRLLTLSGLAHGPAIAERARTLRYQALIGACREEGLLHLLLGHHAGDQAETLAMRVLRSSQTHGLAGMAALRETASVRLLRPLLSVEPARLRQWLTVHGVGWVEDPSNHDLRATRPRLRQGLVSHGHSGTGLRRAMGAVGRLRAQEEGQAAQELAGRTTIRPEGFALLSRGPIGALALGCLLRAIGGLRYLPSLGQIAELAANPGPATVAGVRILAAGRLGDGLLLVREEAAVMAPVAALPGTVWDNRFRLLGDANVSRDATIGKLGDDAARLRHLSDLPSAVLRTLPAIRIGKVLEAVPHLRYAGSEYAMHMTVIFSPPVPAGGPVFVTAR